MGKGASRNPHPLRIMLRTPKSPHRFRQNLIRRQMTTLEHLHRERKRYRLLARKCLPHIYLVHHQLVACHESTLPLGLSLSKEN